MSSNITITADDIRKCVEPTETEISKIKNYGINPFVTGSCESYILRKRGEISRPELDYDHEFFQFFRTGGIPLNLFATTFRCRETGEYVKVEFSKASIEPVDDPSYGVNNINFPKL